MYSMVIKFDKESSKWKECADYNEMLIRTNIRFIHEFVKKKGYVYLVDIYELFGLKWNPEWENKCFTSIDEFVIAYTPDENLESYTITIHTIKD